METSCGPRPSIYQASNLNTMQNARRKLSLENIENLRFYATVNSLFIEVQGTSIFFRNNQILLSREQYLCNGEKPHFDISGHFVITEFD